MLKKHKSSGFSWLSAVALVIGVMMCGNQLAAAPVHEAAHSGNYQQLLRIIENGVDVDSRDTFGGTALHAAMFQDNPEIVRLLIKKGFDVNAVGPRNGYTPLHDAVWANNSEAAEILLQAGARTDIRALDGLTARQKAQKESKPILAQLIETAQNREYDRKAREELSENDIKAFVYAWFAKFDHQVPIEELARHLGENVDMAFPDFPINSRADFARWYQGVTDNIQWNSHEISNLQVSGDESSGWSVSMDIRWRARTYEGEQYDIMVHQDWDLVKSADGTLLFKRHRAQLLN